MEQLCLRYFNELDFGVLGAWAPSVESVEAHTSVPVLKCSTLQVSTLTVSSQVAHCHFLHLLEETTIVQMPLLLYLLLLF